MSLEDKLKFFILPTIEEKIKIIDLYGYKEEKEGWVMQVVEIVRQFRELKLDGKEIYNKDFGMLFEQAYDGFLTI